MNQSEYVQHDGLGLAQLVRDGEISADQLLDNAIQQMEATNETINAVIYPLIDHAREAIRKGLPDGPFTGVPFLLKDLTIYLKGTPTSHGSRLFHGIPADHDSNLTRRYKQAGLVIFGKTNTPEFGLATSTEPCLWGATRNPWNPDYSSGGSSGGASAAVAAGYTPLAHASDGGGSIRIPACATGLFGLKPTRGRTPMGPDQGEGWNGSSCLHAVTRSVRDSAALLDASAGEDTGAPYSAPHQDRPYLQQLSEPLQPLRIALCTRAFNGAEVDAENIAAAREAARLCESLGHKVEEASPRIEGELLAQAHTTIVFANIAALLEKREKDVGKQLGQEDIEKVTWVNWQTGKQISASDYVQAVQTTHRISRDFAGFFNQWDIILTPTMACTTPLIGKLNMNTEDMESYGNLIGRTIGFTSLFNNTGCPAMSVPLSEDSQGLPLGIQFGAAFGNEGLLLQLASQLEEAKPWFHKHPDSII